MQGVSFRWFTKQQADELGISGWVRNLQDGRVEIVASGFENELAQLMTRLKTGPKIAKVTDVASKEIEESVDASRFDIIETVANPAY